MTSIQKYMIAGTALLVFVIGSFLYILHWDTHNVSTAISSRDAVWQDSLSRARDIHREWIDSTLKAQAKQTIAFKNKPKPDTTQYIDIEPTQEDSAIFHAGFNSGIDYEKHQVDILDTNIVFSNGDSLSAYHNPITHQVTLGLVPYPVKEYTHMISDSLLVGEPCPPVQWYNSNGAWMGYGAAAVLVVIEAFHLIAK